MGTESFIINRIAVSEKLGPDAFAGFTGRIPQMDNTASASIRVRRGRSVLDQYYKTFYSYLTPENFKPYLSNPAFQSKLFAFLKANQISSGENFKRYRAILSVFSAIVFSFLVVFLTCEFGMVEACLCVLAILQLDWIIASASHFFWFSGLMFAPFVFNLFALRLKNWFSFKYFVFIFVFNLILSLSKCLTSGFEVIPSFLVMSCLPPFYYYFSKSWKPRKFFYAFLLLSVSSLTGVGAAMTIHAQQIDILKGEDGAGKKHLLSSFTRRSTGKNRIRPNLPDRIKESYSVSAIDVINKYYNEPLITWNTGPRSTIPILSSNYLIYILSGLSLFWFLRFFFKKFANPFSGKVKGLIFMSWVAVLAPLSMFVSFKSLSWLHPHLVPITWNMPFSILIMLLLIYSARIIIGDIISNITFK